MKVKNPISVPTSTIASEPTNTWPLITAGISKIAAQIAAMPAAAPSMLSRKLNAFMIRTIQNAERHVVIILLSMKNSTRVSASAATAIATANCTNSLKNGPRCFLSSQRPSAKSVQIASRITISWSNFFRKSAGSMFADLTRPGRWPGIRTNFIDRTQTQMKAAMVAKIAIPPPKGTVLWPNLSFAGLATNPVLRAKIRTIAVSAIEKMNEAAKRAKADLVMV